MNSKYDNKELARRFREMGDKFIALDKDVDMHNARYPSCGSPACHGGWAGVLLDCNRKIDNYYYEDGADSLAIFFGFEDHYDLEVWAGEKQEIWGNKDGEYMFSSEDAFGCKEYDITTKDIGNHYHGVADRLEAL